MGREPRPRTPAEERRLAELVALLGDARDAGPAAGAEDPDEVAARRIERAVASAPELARELLEDPELDRILRAEAVEPPSAAEWARVDAAISAATGVPLGSGAAGARGAARPRRSLLAARLLVPLAAAAVLGVIVLREAFVGGPAPAAEATIVEVDLPDDRSYLILAGEEESDGVMIFITSS